jgi:signal transduction histidine kinase/CheY-like chemotaxis protein
MPESHNGFMPHGQCFLWQPNVLWINVSSDLFITAAYYVISAALFYFLFKRRDVPFRWMFMLFGLFIFACGTTHLMHVWTVWHPDYWAEGMVKAGTALLSFSTGLLLVPLLPKAMALRTPQELETVNASLREALSERQKAVENLQASEAKLIRRSEELIQQRQTLRQMASQLTLIEQRERRRLATDLHDYLAQLLVVCRLKVSRAKKGLKTSMDVFWDELNADLDQCLKYTRTLVSELCPTALYQSGLVVALHQLAKELEKYDLHVTLVAEDSDIPLSDDDAILMYQTVRELLFNVLKHAKTSQAQVRLKKTPQHEVEVNVEDKGQGFDPASLLQRSFQGFGLLSIRERIEAMSGRFHIQSSLGGGTTATFALPLSSPPDVAPSTPTGSLPLDSGTSVVMTSSDGLIGVLLVDDHAMVRQGLRSVLEGYPDIAVLGEACNGEEAVKAVEHLRPSIVVMDINMPQMDGIEATKRIKSRYPEVVVVGLSVNAGSDTLAAMLNAGAASLITKEAAVDQLYTAIQNSLRKSADA